MASSRSLGSLTLDLILKMGGFEQGMNKAARTTDSRMRQMEQRAFKFGKAIGVSLAAVGGVISTGVGIAIAGIRSAINSMDDLSKAAQRSQVPTEQFTALAYAGELADVSMEDLQSSLGRLAKAQGDSLKETTKQSKIFDALGIAAEDATGKLRPTYDVFLDFADAFKRNQGSPEILAAGMQIFGRSFQNLIPLLKDGSQGLRDAADEGRDLGKVFGDEAGRNAEEFNDNLTRLKSSVQGLWISVATELLPDLIQLTNEFKDWVTEGGRSQKLADDIAESIRGIAGAIRSVGSVLGVLDNLNDVFQGIQGQADASGRAINAVFTLDRAKLGQALEDYKEASHRIGKGMGEGQAEGFAEGFSNVRSSVSKFSKDLTGLFVPDAEAIRRQEQEAKRLRDALGGDASGSKNKKKSGKTDAEREAEQLVKSYESLNERLAETKALFGQTGEAAKVRYQVETDDLSKLDAKTKEYVQTLQAQAISGAELIDQMELMDELDDAALKRVEQESEAFAERMKSNEELIEDMEFELKLLGMTNEEREREIALRYLSKDATDEQKEAVARLSEELTNAIEAEQNWNQLQDSISNGLYDIISGAESAGDAIKNFLDDLNAQILKNITDDWAESLTDWFKNFASGSGSSGGGGFWSSILGAFGFGGGRAGGGTTRPFSATRVNEVGFEMATVNGNDYLLTGSQPVNVTSSNQVPRGGTTVVNMTVQGRIDKRSEARIAREISVRQRMAMVGA